MLLNYHTYALRLLEVISIFLSLVIFKIIFILFFIIICGNSIDTSVMKRKNIHFCLFLLLPIYFFSSYFILIRREWHDALVSFVYYRVYTHMHFFRLPTTYMRHEYRLIEVSVDGDQDCRTKT